MPASPFAPVRPDSPLTRRQREVYAAVLAWIEAEGVPPSIRDLYAPLGVASPNGVLSLLKPLRRRGLMCESQVGPCRSWHVVGLAEFLAPHVAAFAAAKLREIDARA